MSFPNTRWEDYGTCPICSAVTGDPCTARRMIARKIVPQPLSFPHKLRPHQPQPEPEPETEPTSDPAIRPGAVRQSLIFRRALIAMIEVNEHTPHCSHCQLFVIAGPRRKYTNYCPRMLVLRERINAGIDLFTEEEMQEVEAIMRRGDVP
jgi:hypothetical protein